MGGRHNCGGSRELDSHEGAHMARKLRGPAPVKSPHLTYMSALQDIADQSQRELARMMPHYGERGRIAEEIIKSVLVRTLPKRFSIGTGIVISAHGDVS